MATGKMSQSIVMVGRSSALVSVWYSHTRQNMDLDWDQLVYDRLVQAGQCRLGQVMFNISAGGSLFTDLEGRHTWSHSVEE